MIDLLLLASLSPGPKHGYQLKREAGLISGQGVLHNNLVYPLLRRFLAKKWVTRKTVPGERGQMRHQYALTSGGRQELVDRLSNFSEQEARARDEFYLRVGMFQLLDQPTRQRILELREQFLRARIEKLTAIQENFTLDTFGGEVTTHFCREAEAELKWIQRLRKISS